MTADTRTLIREAFEKTEYLLDNDTGLDPMAWRCVAAARWALLAAKLIEEERHA